MAAVAAGRQQEAMEVSTDPSRVEASGQLHRNGALLGRRALLGR